MLWLTEHVSGQMTQHAPHSFSDGQAGGAGMNEYQYHAHSLTFLDQLR